MKLWTIKEGQRLCIGEAVVECPRGEKQIKIPVEAPKWMNVWVEKIPDDSVQCTT